RGAEEGGNALKRKGPPGSGGPNSERLSPRGRDRSSQAILVTFAAAGPFLPGTMSNSTRSPSARLLKPLPWISEWWTKQSALPSSGVMKPNPLLSLNHFTRPVLRIVFVLSLWCCDGPETRKTRQNQVPLRVCLVGPRNRPWLRKLSVS